MKQQLDEELTGIVFTQHESILRQLNSRSKQEKVKRFLNKEITLPVLPVMAIMACFFVGASIDLISFYQIETNELIEVQGNIVWSDLFQERVRGQ